MNVTCNGRNVSLALVFLKDKIVVLGPGLGLEAKSLAAWALRVS